LDSGILVSRPIAQREFFIDPAAVPGKPSPLVVSVYLFKLYFSPNLISELLPLLAIHQDRDSYVPNPSQDISLATNPARIDGESLSGRDMPVVMTMDSQISTFVH
jgi:hypothetical protein